MIGGSVYFALILYTNCVLEMACVTAVKIPINPHALYKDSWIVLGIFFTKLHNTVTSFHMQVLIFYPRTLPAKTL